MGTAVHTLVVGLGNPGSDYSFTRHNIGFMLADTLAEAAKAPAWQKKFQGQFTTATLGEHSFFLLKPTTFMNLSGQAVGEACRFYKIDPANVIVIHDDIDLTAGRVKVKQGGGHGGHNGLKSIDQHIGQAYWRVRLGVGHPGDKNLVVNYVLGKFAKADQDWLVPLLTNAVKAFPRLLAGKPNDFAAAAGIQVKAPSNPTA